ITTIADDSGPFSSVGAPSLNAGGTVAFLAELDAGGQGIFTGSGGPITTIADTTGPFGFFGNPALNAGGTVAFIAFPDAGGQGIFTGSGGPTTTIADTTGPFSSFSEPALNAGGTVAFGAFLDAGGTGIFTGPNPATDAVIRTGDPLFGATVRVLVFSRDRLNDSGQVAFSYSLNNGVSGIAVATPQPAQVIPEPASLLLSLLGAGLLWWRRRWA
ncbi:MAG: PEP-CTERM sorting domain-containing protein, partial [Gemmataceae bacterium]|nr:PEP-CTERM sorting domain-containing protein [Gemmataceae bacterium]